MSAGDFDCYVCGGPIAALDFVLVALSKGVDRAFILHTACVIRVADDGATICYVKEDI